MFVVVYFKMGIPLCRSIAVYIYSVHLYHLVNRDSTISEKKIKLLRNIIFLSKYNMKHFIFCVPESKRILFDGKAAEIKSRSEIPG